MSLLQIKWVNPYTVLFVTMWSQLLLIMSGVNRFTERFYQIDWSPKPWKLKEKYNNTATCHFFLLLTSKAQQHRGTDKVWMEKFYYPDIWWKCHFTESIALNKFICCDDRFPPGSRKRSNGRLNYLIFLEHFLTFIYF